MHLFKWLHLKKHSMCPKAYLIFVFLIITLGIRKDTLSQKTLIHIKYILLQCSFTFFNSVFLYSEVLTFSNYNIYWFLSSEILKCYLAKLFNSSSSVKALPLYIKKPITSLHNAKPWKKINCDYSKWLRDYIPGFSFKTPVMKANVTTVLLNCPRPKYRWKTPNLGFKNSKNARCSRLHLICSLA